MKYLDLKTGSFISLALALMMLVPRMVRFDDMPMAVFFLGLLNAFGFAFFCWICQRILLFGQPWVALMPKWWVRSAVILLICPFASIFHYQLAGYWLLHAYFFETLDEEQISALLCFRGLLIGGFMLMTSYYLNELAKAQQSKLELQQLKQENLEARLKSLREQLSPHFLFNSLNTLQSMSADKEVKDFIIHLADVYRYLLGLQDNHLVSISEELAFIRSYIFVLKARFEEALQVNISVNSECELLCVPPLAIQNLIENAIKHNIVSRQKPLEVSVTCEGTKWLVVTNNKQLKLHVNSTGFGLASINDRYRLLADLEIEIHDQPESFIVKLPLLKC